MKIRSIRGKDRPGKRGFRPGILLLTLLFLWMQTFSGFAAWAEDGEDLSVRLGRLKRQYEAVGLAVVAWRDGEILFRYEAGYADRGNRTPVSPDTYFRVASVTKMISAIRVMQLVEQGKLDPDQDLSGLMGYPVRNPYNGGILTPRMLMTHTASLREGEYRFPDHSLRELIGDRRIRDNRFTSSVPGSEYLYSNFGAGILGSLIEKIEGINAGEAVRRGVFEPLGIEAGYSPQMLPEDARIACLYNQDGSLRRGKNQWASMEWDEGCDPERHFDITVGDLLIRPDDLCMLGMMLASEGSLNSVRLLRSETVRAMRASQQGEALITADSPYGLCVHRDSRLLPGYTLYGHQGHMWGTLCSLYFEPASGFTVAVVSNGCRMVMDQGTSKLAENIWALLWEKYSPGDAFLVREQDEETVSSGGADPGEKLVPAGGEASNQTDGIPYGDTNPEIVQDTLDGGEARKQVDGVSGGLEPGRPEEGRLKGLKIGIDPGHQAEPDPERETVAPGSGKKKARTAPGTRGIVTGIPEYQTDLEISLALRDALIAEGAEVLLTRETNDVRISNQERARMMNEWGADLVLRIHCNGNSKATVHGIGLYVSKSYGRTDESRTAADCIQKGMTEATGAKNRGISRRDTYTGLNWLTVPGVLVECGYLTNPEEDKKLNDPEYRQKLAAGMAEGICEYFSR